MSHDTPIHVLALGGSLRRASHTRALLRAAQALAPEGVEIMLHRALADIPPYVPGHMSGLRRHTSRAPGVE